MFNIFQIVLSLSAIIANAYLRLSDRKNYLVCH